jgi:hypothetical protein
MTRGAQAMAVLVVVGLLAGRAQACDSGGAKAMAFVVVIGAPAGLYYLGSNITLTAIDASRASQGERLGPGAAITELLLTTPQVAAGSMIAASLHGNDRLIAIAATAWPAFLLGHSVYSLATREERVPAPFYRARLSGGGAISVSPTVVSDGTQLGAGLGAIGRF